MQRRCTDCRKEKKPGGYRASCEFLNAVGTAWRNRPEFFNLIRREDPIVKCNIIHQSRLISAELRIT